MSQQQLQYFTQRDIDWLRKTQTIGGLLTMLIGPRGGGKTTAGSWFIQDSNENFPEIPRISNVPIENAVYVPNILKFLATKLVMEGGEKPYEIRDDGTVHILPRENIPAKMLIVIDEGAISGFESRGSGLYTLNSYLLALSRKLNVDIILISQLMSMIEKRGQWLADFYWLCESEHFPNSNRVQYFQYQIYNESFMRTKTYRMWYYDFEPRLFNPPTFDTNDIPNYEELAEGYRIQFNISDDDMKLYEDVKYGRKHELPPMEVSNEIIIDAKKMFRIPMGRYPGETLILGNKRFQVLQRDWDFSKYQYRYRLREIPDTMKMEGPFSEAEVAE
jgi:hypothetical protein